MVTSKYKRLSIGARLYSLLWTPIVVAVLMYFAVWYLSATNFASFGTISYGELGLAVLATVGRLSVAYVFAILCSVPLALLATSSPRLELIFLPLFDIFESVPILAFFPVFILFFIKLQYLNGAAVFILFLGMLWNIVFTSVSGLKAIPQEIKKAARIFGVTGFSYFRKITLPAIFPQLVTGSILAMAQGWNITIVAEVLHTYAPHGTASDDLFGIGSILVRAASTGNNDTFIAATFAMILAIAFLNFFVWQKLLHYAQRFRFE